jgi:hypothetical protein
MGVIRFRRLLVTKMTLLMLFLILLNANNAFPPSPLLIDEKQCAALIPNKMLSILVYILNKLVTITKHQEIW